MENIEKSLVFNNHNFIAGNSGKFLSQKEQDFEMK